MGLTYADISSKFTKNSGVKNIVAYVENGVVFIYVRLNASATGVVTVQLSDLAYAPRVISLGVYASTSTVNDMNKYIASNISNEGVISIWLKEPLLYEESIAFTYPLKRS